MLSGCAVIHTTGLTETDPTLTTQREGVKKEFDTIPAPAAGKPVSVAVYSFADKTGQRRPQANIASLSTAVTQGAETFLIKALSDVGQGRWFEVVERVGIDNLTKERLIIRQMREAYEGSSAKPLMPMQFAGIIIEGGIVGYDSSTNSGGAGMRIFGIGKQTQWSSDTVTISLRAVSVNTGKVLSSVTVQKTILSTADSVTALKFFDNATKSFEAETGLTINEPGTYAVKAATEMAVVELIKEGQRKGVWDYKPEISLKTEPPAISFVPAQPAAPVISSEVKVEEKKDVVVQSQTKSETKTEAAPSAAAEVTANLKPVVSKQGLKVEQPNEVTLSEAQYIYKEPNDKSQKTWMFKKGTQVIVVKEYGDWVEVRDAEKRKGFVRKDVFVNKQQ
jgi:curli production assembly/transport component CsgG